MMVNAIKGFIEVEEYTLRRLRDCCYSFSQSACFPPRALLSDNARCHGHGHYWEQWVWPTVPSGFAGLQRVYKRNLFGRGGGRGLGGRPSDFSASEIPASGVRASGVWASRVRASRVQASGVRASGVRASEARASCSSPRTMWTCRTPIFRRSKAYHSSASHKYVQPGLFWISNVALVHTTELCSSQFRETENSQHCSSSVVVEKERCSGLLRNALKNCWYLNEVRVRVKYESCSRPNYNNTGHAGHYGSKMPSYALPRTPSSALRALDGVLGSAYSGIIEP